MKYSNTILTDDNFDEELEKLCSKININYIEYESFFKKLPKDFTLQNNNGIDEWISYSINPDFSSDCKQAYQKGYLAYEFGNGFMVFNFEVVL